jgi:tetratricopeptide (TPR) repeat protein
MQRITSFARAVDLGRSRSRLPAGLVLAAALLAPAPASAAISIIGGGLGRECFLAAELKRETRSSLETCNRALDESLSRRDRAATYVNRGIIHMQAREIDNALRDYDNALKLDPNVAEAHVNRGIALLHKGGADKEAIAALTRGLEMNPARPEVALFTRAVAHEMVGNVREAFEDYQAAAALKPEWTEPAEQLKRFSIEKRSVARG